MKDNRGFSLILCGEFHGINVGAYVKNRSTNTHFICTLVNRRVGSKTILFGPNFLSNFLRT
jgi:hypothetical protein